MSMKLTDYLGDKPFWKVTVRLAVPVALQNVLTSSFQLVDTLMVSRLGDVTLSAVGMAAQWGWMAGLLSFGLCSGMSVFISQYWGIQNLKGIRRARFWMTFSENYLNHLKVLGNVGMTGIEPVEFQGQQIVPIQFLGKLLPDPASLGPLTKGKTCIGCVMKGVKDGKEKSAYIYNICDHEACYAEVGSQAISYTTGVPAMIGAMMMVTGKWMQPGVWNMEQLDPDPFMEQLNLRGLPWVVQE